MAIEDATLDLTTPAATGENSLGEPVEEPSDPGLDHSTSDFDDVDDVDGRLDVIGEDETVDYPDEPKRIKCVRCHHRNVLGISSRTESKIH